MKIRPVLVVLLAIALQISLLLALGYFLATALGIPSRLGLSPGLRLLGVIPLLIGFSVLLWVFKYRPPMTMLLSTYSMLVAALARQGSIVRPRRPEPLVIAGPHRFVRHPLYTAVVLLMVGWWIVLDLTSLAFCAGLMALWFSLLVGPFEERELRDLFGEQYATYARTTPRFIPSIRRQKPPDQND